MIVEISEILNSFNSKWACLLSNGTIVETSMQDENLNKIKILRMLRAIIPKTQVGSVVMFSDLIIYRPTSDFFIFVLGRFPRNIIKDKFSAIGSMYKSIDKEYKKKTKSDAIKIKFVLFSMSKEKGPEPILVIPENYDNEVVFKVSMKSLLTLSVESNGANKEMISFLPFVDLDALGIVHTFQIEDKKARGNAYDSAITILVDYQYRGIIYENYDTIEKTLIEVGKNFILEYATTKDYKNIINSTLKRNLKNISFETVEPEDIKSEMMEEIKKLAKF